MKLQLNCNLIFVFNVLYFSKQTSECIYIEFHCDKHYHVLPCELSVIKFYKRIIKLCLICLALKMASMIIDDIDKMILNLKGFCVIFNVLNFDGNCPLEKCDLIKSFSLIKDTFELLKFDVKIYQDLSDGS